MILEVIQLVKPSASLSLTHNNELWYKLKEELSLKHKHEPLHLELMMFGKKKVSRFELDEDGNKIISHYTKSGNPSYKKKNVYITESKYNGDKGIFPSVNTIYRNGRNGRKEYTAMANNKFDEWLNHVNAWADQNNWEVKNEKIIMDILFIYPNDNRTRDSHNILKMLLDTLSPAIAKDDHLILPRIQDFRKAENNEEPSLLIYFSYMSDYYAN